MELHIFIVKFAIIFAHYRKELKRKVLKYNFYLIHCRFFTNLTRFWNTLGNPINLLSLESQGRMEHQYNFYQKKKKESEVEKNEDEN